MAHVSPPLKSPLPGDARDTENVQWSVGDVLAREVVEWISVPAEPKYGRAVGDHHHSLPC